MTSRRPMLAIAGVLCVLSLATPAALQAAEPDDTFFELKIRPVLAGRCFKCHGGDKVTNNLRVDSLAALVQGGDNGPAIVPGKPDQSPLLHAIRRDGQAEAMPPDEPLPAEVVADFTAWIQAGAAWPTAPAGRGSDFQSAGHWAFRPVVDPPVPDDPSGWSDHPLDRFVRAKQRERGLNPVGPAGRATLVRRVYFDLIGLPPAPEDVDALVSDTRPEWFAILVERLLASPRYGERWGRHWMDVARYADTAGDNADYPIPEVRRYRDYIIAAFNADKPYDEFVREQLAGDILAREGPAKKFAERVTATGFLALSRRYATAPFELWHLSLEDTVDTVGRAFLGLSLRCARCHDHKFDPVTTADYYALYGVFSSTRFPYAGSEELSSKQFPRSGFVPLEPPGISEPRMQAYGQEVERLKAEIKQAESSDPLVAQRAELDAQLKQTPTSTTGELSVDAAGKAAEERKALEARRKEVHTQLEAKLKSLRDAARRRERPGLPDELVGAYAVWEGTPADTPIQVSGDPGRPGPVARRGPPRFLAASAGDWQPAAGQSGRRELAEWLTRPENPLTTRVLVNRVWQHYFGRGIVATPSNFGLRGTPPTHPELLDHLATRFVAGGWSIKSLHRLILSSRTYQLASETDPHNAGVDPANHFYWRADRRRLDAEAIRDAMLAISGRLDLRVPPNHPFPPIDEWRWTQHSPFKSVYDSNYRSVYLMTQRIVRHPFLALFDGPDTNSSTELRTSAIVPLQALYLMNDPYVQEQARGLADRVIAAASDPRERVERACRLVWSRVPTPAESEQMAKFVVSYEQELERSGAPAAEREREAWTGLARTLLCSNEFIYLD